MSNKKESLSGHLYCRISSSGDWLAWSLNLLGGMNNRARPGVAQMDFAVLVARGDPLSFGRLSR